MAYQASWLNRQIHGATVDLDLGLHDPAGNRPDVKIPRSYRLSQVTAGFLAAEAAVLATAEVARQNAIANAAAVVGKPAVQNAIGTLVDAVNSQLGAGIVMLVAAIQSQGVNDPATLQIIAGSIAQQIVGQIDLVSSVHQALGA